MFCDPEAGRAGMPDSETRRWRRSPRDHDSDRGHSSGYPNRSGEPRRDREARARERPINPTVAFLFLALLAYAIFNHEETAWEPSQAGPDLVATPCWFERPEWLTVSCHHLRVPETREISLRTARTPRDKELMLPVVVVHGRADGDAAVRQDPVVYLAGGPGSGALIDADRISY